MMNIYVPPNGAVEDLVYTLEELRPGLVRSRLVLEVSTDDKSLGALLKKISEGIPDEMNADGLVAAARAGKEDSQDKNAPASLTAFRNKRHADRDDVAR
jgi:hypothetical protein